MTSAAPEARTLQGTVRGIRHGAGQAFLGIPYAEPPIGDLRFAAPSPPPPWDGVRDASAYGATPLRRDFGDTTLIPEPPVPGDATLNVNVFTPAADPDSRLPVWVWIHGGGYTSGSPASPWYDGAAFARDGVVTVTLSYRLGFDGFGWIEGAPQNRAVRDWLAALEWVRANIGFFGGDPGRVTIAGQSAGGGAVLTLLGMPAAQPLFHRVWCSSPALGDIAADRSRAIAARLAAVLDVAPDRDGFASVDPDVIVGAQERATQEPGTKGLAVARGLLHDGVGLGPVVDGELIARPTLESVRAGTGADKPVVIGANDDEFTMITMGSKILRFVPARLALGALGATSRAASAYLRDNRAVRRRGTGRLVGRYVTDRTFRAGVARFADARAAGKGTDASPAPTWLYRLAWTSPTHGIALHCLDVPFVFDVLDAPRVTEIAGASPPHALADAMHGAAVAFVRDGTPGWAPAPEGRRGRARLFDVGSSAPDVVSDAYASVNALG
jgi:para-nitrobenzyl esterase